MPRKTRQEKILAKLHRLQEKQNINDPSPIEEPKNQPQKGNISFDLQALGNKNSSITQKSESLDYSYVQKDLRKTLAFVVLAVAFEIALSLLISRYPDLVGFRLF